MASEHIPLPVMHSTKRLDPDYKQIGMAMNSALPAVTQMWSQDRRELSDVCPYTSSQADRMKHIRCIARFPQPWAGEA